MAKRADLQLGPVHTLDFKNAVILSEGEAIDLLSSNELPEPKSKDPA